MNNPSFKLRLKLFVPIAFAVLLGYLGYLAIHDRQSFYINDVKAVTREGVPEYDFNEALDHIGEEAFVKGEILSVYTSKTNTTFLDYCEDSRKCPFTAVIFSSAKDKFGDVSSLVGRRTLKGIIKSYKGKAEIILESPEQINQD